MSFTFPSLQARGTDKNKAKRGDFKGAWTVSMGWPHKRVVVLPYNTNGFTAKDSCSANGRSMLVCVKMGVAVRGLTGFGTPQI